MTKPMAIYRSEEGGQQVRVRYRDFLGRWPVPNQHLRVPTRAGETFVVACGPPQAPPLVLLHGSTANAACWMGDVPAWSEHFRVYAIDMIGEPGLSAESRPDLGGDEYAEWLDDVLEGLAVTRPAVVGVSLGGWLALDYATRRPGRIGKLALLCPGGIGRQKWAVLLLAPFLLPFGERGTRTFIRLMLGSPLPDNGPGKEFGDFMLLIAKHFRPRRVTLPVFGDDDLARLDMPVLAVVGGRDRVIDSRETRQRLGRAVPQAEVRLLPDAGHLLIDQTEPVLDFLLASGGAVTNPGDGAEAAS